MLSTSTFDQQCLGHLLLLVHHGQWPCHLTLWAVLQIEIYCGIDIFIGVFVSARYAIAYIGKNRSIFAPGRQPPCYCHYTEKTYHCHQGRQSGILLLAFRNNADNHPGFEAALACDSNEPLEVSRGLGSRSMQLTAHWNSLRFSCRITLRKTTTLTFSSECSVNCSCHAIW